MNGLRLVLLHMIQRMNGERTVSGCYHILKGKKSGQAIQDAALFGYQSWFGVFPRLDRHVFQGELQSLLRDSCIRKSSSKQKESGEDFYVLTSLGRQVLESEVAQFRLHKRGFLLADKGISMAEVVLFWDALQLLSQVLSFSLNGKAHYAPIITDTEIQARVKLFWSRIEDKQLFAKRLLDELREHFNQMEDLFFPELLSSRLSGYRVAGLTFSQLEQRFQIPDALLQLFLFQGAGDLLSRVRVQRSSCLYALTTLSHPIPMLTASARKTYDYFKQGLSLVEIARYRRLKESTIEDHLIEIAIHDPTFDTAAFVAEELLVHIQQVSLALQTKKLSVIMKELKHEASYFQIRLALLKE